MNDATGMAQSVVLLGGTSEIGLAILDELARGELVRMLPGWAPRSAGTIASCWPGATRGRSKSPGRDSCGRV